MRMRKWGRKERGQRVEWRKGGLGGKRQGTLAPPTSCPCSDRWLGLPPKNVFPGRGGDAREAVQSASYPINPAQFSGHLIAATRAPGIGEDGEHHTLTESVLGAPAAKIFPWAFLGPSSLSHAPLPLFHVLTLLCLAGYPPPPPAVCLLVGRGGREAGILGAGRGAAPHGAWAPRE